MKKLIYTLPLVLGLLIIHQTNASSYSTISANSFKPFNAEKQRMAYITQLFYAFDPVCQKYGINTKVAITQAIVEQGWIMREDYRIFNIMSVSPNNSKVVYDHGERRYRRYRVYHSLEEAIEDYCKVLSSYPTYRAHGLFETIDPHRQIKAIVDGGYATNVRYEELSLRILNEFVSPIVDDLRTRKALLNQQGFKKEAIYGINRNDIMSLRLPMD
ncbi:glucosaminidase domain-containing protein [Limibacter armeniacum]|uniref:glucosaminidase domain-containing protein n=1 Tax=Limibacter armeniacum TaxID=466084 RepID=UPI002FE5D6C8